MPASLNPCSLNKQGQLDNSPATMQRLLSEECAATTELQTCRLRHLSLAAGGGGHQDANTHTSATRKQLLAPPAPCATLCLHWLVSATSQTRLTHKTQLVNAIAKLQAIMQTGSCLAYSLTLSSCSHWTNALHVCSSTCH